MRHESSRDREVVEEKGDAVSYSEFDGRHDYLTRRGSLADGLIALVEKQSDSEDESALEPFAIHKI
jgi:hypothetical protein